MDTNPYTPLPKEVMFLWADVDVLKTKTAQSDVDEQVTEIWKAYFETDVNVKAFLKPESIEEVRNLYTKGAPFDASIYDKVQKEIFTLALDGPVRFCLANFSVACLYKTRVSKLSSDVPDEVYPKLLEELDDKHWYQISNKKGFVGYRNHDKTFKGFHFKSVCEINRPADVTLDILWDINRREEWEHTIISTKVLEKLSSRTEVTYMMTKILGGSGDFLFLQTKKVMPDGTIGVMCTSVEHPLAPEIKGVPRNKLEVYAIAIRPLGENKCKCEVYYQSHVGQKFVNFLMDKFDWFLLMATKNFKNVKKVLEGQDKKRDRKLTGDMQ